MKGIVVVHLALVQTGILVLVQALALVMTANCSIYWQIYCEAYRRVLNKMSCSARSRLPVNILHLEHHSSLRTYYNLIIN